jgi:hypothetical protein
MFRTTLLNSFKIKTTIKQIYQRIYKRTYEQLEFDADCGIYLGFIIGSSIGSYKVIEHYKGNIYKIESILHTVFVTTIGAIFGGSWGCLCGYLYPYGLVVLPSIIVSYNIYHKYNVHDKIKNCELVLDDLSLTQKSIN